MFFFHKNDRTRPMIISDIYGTKNIFEVENVFTRYLLRPMLDSLVIVLFSYFWIVILLVKHGLDEEGVEEVRSFPAGQFGI